MLTPASTSASAMRITSSRLRDTPGSCLPSLKVMSQSWNFSGSVICERISSEKQCCDIRQLSVVGSKLLFTG